jgi:hypothetical protein
MTTWQRGQAVADCIRPGGGGYSGSSTAQAAGVGRQVLESEQEPELWTVHRERNSQEQLPDWCGVCPSASRASRRRCLSF